MTNESTKPAAVPAVSNTAPTKGNKSQPAAAPVAPAAAPAPVTVAVPLPITQSDGPAVVLKAGSYANAAGVVFKVPLDGTYRSSALQCAWPTILPAGAAAWFLIEGTLANGQGRAAVLLCHSLRTPGTAKNGGIAGEWKAWPVHGAGIPVVLGTFRDMPAAKDTVCAPVTA